MHARKDTLQTVIGKTIQSIIFRSGRDVNPETQLFLVFEDDTYFEFFGQEIYFVRSLSRGDTTKAIDYARKFGTEGFVVSGNETKLLE
jgi:hypothetical protein